jgi:hypothetical protein
MNPEWLATPQSCLAVLGSKDSQNRKSQLGGSDHNLRGAIVKEECHGARAERQPT